MTCEDIEILISAYIDREVTEEEKQIVEHHLNICHACRDTLSDFSELHTLFGELEEKEVVQGFRQRVTQRIEAKPRFELSWARIPRVVYALCFSLLIVLGVTTLSFYLNQEPAVSPQQEEQAALEINVYAEDFLFEESVFDGMDLFSSTLSDTSAGEEILDILDFTETDTSWLGKNVRTLST